MVAAQWSQLISTSSLWLLPPAPSCKLLPHGCDPNSCPLTWQKCWDPKFYIYTFTTHQHWLLLAATLTTLAVIETFSLGQDAAIISSAQPQILSTIVIKTNRCLNIIDCNVWLSKLHHNINRWYGEFMPREECQKMCQKLIFCHPYSLKAHNSRFTVATNVKESSPGDSKQGRPANSRAFVALQ